MSEKTVPETITDRQTFSDGMLVDAKAMMREQNYHRASREMLTRTLINPGIINEFVVTQDGGKILVGPGVAIDEVGRIIVLGKTATGSDNKPLIINNGLIEVPIPPIALETELSLVISYHELPPDPVTGSTPLSPMLSFVKNGGSGSALQLATVLNKGNSATSPAFHVDTSIQKRYGLEIQGDARAKNFVGDGSGLKNLSPDAFSKTIPSCKIDGLSEFEDELQSLVEKTSCQGKQLSGLGDKTADLSGRVYLLEPLLEKVADLKNALLTLGDAAADLSGRIYTLEPSLESVAELEKNLASMGNITADLSGRIYLLETLLDKVANLSTELDSIKSVSSGFETVDETLKGLSEGLSELQNVTHSLETQLSTTRTAVTSVENLTKSLSKKSDSIDTDNKQNADEVRKIKGIVNRLAKFEPVLPKLVNWMKRGAEISDQLSSAVEDIGTNREKIATLERDVDKLGQSLDRLEPLSGKLSDLDKRLGAVSATCASIPGQISDLTGKMNTLENKVDATDKPTEPSTAISFYTDQPVLGQPGPVTLHWKIPKNYEFKLAFELGWMMIELSSTSQELNRDAHTLSVSRSTTFTLTVVDESDRTVFQQQLRITVAQASIGKQVSPDFNLGNLNRHLLMGFSRFLNLISDDQDWRSAMQRETRESTFMIDYQTSDFFGQQQHRFTELWQDFENAGFEKPVYTITGLIALLVKDAGHWNEFEQLVATSTREGLDKFIADLHEVGADNPQNDHRYARIAEAVFDVDNFLAGQIHSGDFLPDSVSAKMLEYAAEKWVT